MMRIFNKITGIRLLTPLRGAVAMVICCLCATVTAQTNEIQEDSTTDFESFKILVQRNIFDPNRRPYSEDTKPDNPPEEPPVVDTIALVGTLISQGGAYAFFDGSSPEFKSARKTSESISNLQLARIDVESVVLKNGQQEFKLQVGSGLLREDNGPWKITDKAAGSLQSRTQSRITPSTPGTGRTSNEASPEMNDVLKQMMLKRQQELQNE